MSEKLSYGPGNIEFDGGPVEESLVAWCGLTPAIWREKKSYITGRKFGDLLVHSGREYQLMLPEKPDVPAALEMVAFEQARTLWKHRGASIMTSLEEIRAELVKSESFCAGFDVDSEALRIWEHEVAHWKESVKMGIDGFLILLCANQHGYIAGIVNNISSLRNAVNEGLNLAYFYGRLLAAPFHARVYHYTDEDRTAVELLQAAKSQGVILREEDEDLLVYWQERYLPSWRRTPTVWNRFTF